MSLQRITKRTTYCEFLQICWDIGGKWSRPVMTQWDVKGLLPHSNKKGISFSTWEAIICHKEGFIKAESLAWALSVDIISSGVWLREHALEKDAHHAVPSLLILSSFLFQHPYCYLWMLQMTTKSFRICLQILVCRICSRGMKCSWFCIILFEEVKE